MKSYWPFWILLSFSFQLCADSARWEYIGPDGATVWYLRADRTHPGIVFAVTETHSIYRSRDGGNSWKLIFRTKDLEDVAIHPGTCRVYVAAEQGFWISDDHGSSFRKTADRGPVSEFLVHPENPDVIYAQYSESMFFTKDFGRHWYGIPMPGTEDDYWTIQSAAIPPYDPLAILVSGSRCRDTEDDYVCEQLTIVSRNAGRSWRNFMDAAVTFFPDPAFPDRVLSLASDRVILITQKGAVEVGKADLDFIASVPGSPNELYGIQNRHNKKNSFLRSEDLGRTWLVQPDTPDSLNQMTAIGVHPSLLLGVTEWLGILRKGEGSGWARSSSGIRETRFLEIELSGDQLYANSPSMLWSRPGQGGAWSYQRQMESFNLFVDPFDEKHLFRNYLNRFSMTQSTDGGRNWSRIGPYDEVTFTRDPMVVYFRGFNRFLWTSNGGKTIEKLPLLVYPARTLADPYDTAVLYFLFTYSGIYRTTDGGRTMSNISAGLNQTTLRYITALGPRNTLVTINFHNEIFKTVNGGETWEKIGKVPGSSDSSLSSPYLIPIYAGDWSGEHLYVITRGKLFETRNGGRSWKDVGPEDPGVYVISMTDPKLAPVFVATNHGIFERK